MHQRSHKCLSSSKKYKQFWVNSHGSGPEKEISYTENYAEVNLRV